LPPRKRKAMANPTPMTRIMKKKKALGLIDSKKSANGTSTADGRSWNVRLPL
jgi:hypothetical protein